ncbi:esterase FUS5-like isoform X4 [Solanum stenotomum]|uniref:esterase FUS5-like isoform X3 n=1 Tax=Solanum stenotomum TaxID=172797 RepID=UPI0020D143DE|nr:esterase FUS5-like isoform X3 [Solanum stenotomum]XP_049380631.1 esterase FUS5-like isoform X4 [Solanum stenotomum]
MEKQEPEKKKPRILCLHGYGSSAEIFKKVIYQWPESVTGKLDLVFLDGPFPAQAGKSPREGFFDPPYFVWFPSNKDFKEDCSFEECLKYIEDFMLKHGPFDGVLGFSQGTVLCATFPGMQREGVALTKVPKIKFLIIISGAKFGGPTFSAPPLASNAFSSPINSPSLHFLGDMDYQKKDGEILLECFVDPWVIHHPEGHTIPKLDGSNLEIMLGFIEKVQQL